MSCATGAKVKPHMHGERVCVRVCVCAWICVNVCVGVNKLFIVVRLESVEGNKKAHTHILIYIYINNIQCALTQLHAYAQSEIGAS